MGRTTDSLSFVVKGTCAELGAFNGEPAGDQCVAVNYFAEAAQHVGSPYPGPVGEDCRTEGEQPGKVATPVNYFMPNTPSPLLHPCMPEQSNLDPMTFACGPQGSCGTNFSFDLLLPPAFDDEEAGENFSLGALPPYDVNDNMTGYFGVQMPTVMFDPAPCSYITWGWGMPLEAITPGTPPTSEERSSVDGEPAAERQDWCVESGMILDQQGCPLKDRMHHGVHDGWGNVAMPLDPRDDLMEAPQDSHAWTPSRSDCFPSGSNRKRPPVAYTTVMLRNIPNKYTREMLVKQLSKEFCGRFDFVYLPIDFKNRCNVGYGFINFRTCDACAEFVAKFDGVDVRKCLPGLNSRKVAEVTPARVQGLENNVQRLRNGPIMSELLHHPEWMPLLLDKNGHEKNFPVPDQPCAPAKPRRRTGGGRDEHGGSGCGHSAGLK